MLTSEFTMYKTKNNNQSMAEGILQRVLEIRKDKIKHILSDSIESENRLEHVAYVRGVEYINDSKASNENATWYSLESITKPTIWIVGGKDRKQNFYEMRNLIQKKVKAIICYGENQDRIIHAFEDLYENIYCVDNLNEAVETAYKLGEKDDTVLFSPASPSFDMYENYKERGEEFKQLVRNL